MRSFTTFALTEENWLHMHTLTSSILHTTIVIQHARIDPGGFPGFREVRLAGAPLLQ